MGLGLAAAAGLSASANADTAPPVVVMPDSPHCDLEWVVVGGTEAGEKLQWVDESEAALPDKADLPEIAAQDWLPTPKG